MIKVDEILRTEEAKENYLKALIRVSKSDHVIKESEKQYFYAAAQSLGMKEEGIRSLDECWGDVDIKITFSTKREGVFTIMQIIQLCWVDGEYIDVEKDEVRKIAMELSISSDSVEKIEGWVLRGMEWTLEGDKLLDLQ